MPAGDDIAIGLKTLLPPNGQELSCCRFIFTHRSRQLGSILFWTGLDLYTLTKAPTVRNVTHLADTCWEMLLDAWQRTFFRTFDICSRIHPTSSCTSGSHSRSLHTGYLSMFLWVMFSWSTVLHKMWARHTARVQQHYFEGRKEGIGPDLINSNSTWESKTWRTPGGECRGASGPRPSWQAACCSASEPGSSSPCTPQLELQQHSFVNITLNNYTFIRAAANNYSNHWLIYQLFSRLID